MRRNKQVIRSESIRYRKDGTPVTVSITASPILSLWNRANIMRFLEENLERRKERSCL